MTRYQGSKLRKAKSFRWKFPMPNYLFYMFNTAFLLAVIQILSKSFRRLFLIDQEYVMTIRLAFFFNYFIPYKTRMPLRQDGLLGMKEEKDF